MMARPRKYNPDLEALEFQILIDGVRRLSGVNLEEYDAPALRRQVWSSLRSEKVRTISGLLEKLLHDPDALQRFLNELHRPEPTSPQFFSVLRSEIAPYLRTYPFVRVWQAGAESIRDLYFTAIVLHEEGLHEKTTFYVTDTSQANLERAQHGLFALGASGDLEKTYTAAGGRGHLAEYFSGGRLNGAFKPALRSNMVFAQHNLATDGSFNEFNLISCRHALQPLGESVRARAHDVLYQSLAMFSLLALGPHQTIRNTPHELAYRPLDAAQRIFRKVA